MSDDGLRDDPERGEPEDVCPDCDGPVWDCICEDERQAYAGAALEPYWGRDGDDPGRVRRKPGGMK